ncbi:MAG: NAD(P)-binding domain-containing protein [Actinomycetota bacterium]
MDVAVVGAGRVGTAVAVLLRRAGHRIVAVSGRAATRERTARFLPGVPLLDAPGSADRAELTLIAVPDDSIGPVVAEIADSGGVRPGAWFAHLAGASGLEVLTPVVDAGGGRLALHPLQTFADVEGALERLPGPERPSPPTTRRGSRWASDSRATSERSRSAFRTRCAPCTTPRR